MTFVQNSEKNVKTQPSKQTILLLLFCDHGCLFSCLLVIKERADTGRCGRLAQVFVATVLVDPSALCVTVGRETQANAHVKPGIVLPAAWWFGTQKNQS